MAVIGESALIPFLIGSGGAPELEEPPRVEEGVKPGLLIATHKLVGKLRVGETLLSPTGAWKGGTPTSFTYQWERGPSWAAITGATTQTYTISGLDLGKHLRCTVTAHNAAGQASQVTVETATVLAGAASGNSMWVWGDATDGGLGLGTFADFGHYHNPQPIPNFSSIVKFEFGQSWIGVLKADGTVWHGGSGTVGACGQGRNFPTAGLTQVPLPPNVVDISCYGSSFMALLSNGECRAWGGNSGNQLGNGPRAGVWSPVAVEVSEGVPITGVTQIYMGHICSYYLMADGTVRRAGQMNLQGINEYAEAVAGISNVKKIVGGYQFMIALLNDGTIRIKGRNVYGQLANGKVNEPLGKAATETWVNPGLTGVKDVAVAEYHAMVLLNDGTVRVWGRNHRGQIGNGLVGEPVPTPYNPGISNVIEIIAGGGESSGGNVGDHYSIARLATGTLLGWGGNLQGELGDGTFTVRPLPVAVGLGITDATLMGNGESKMGVLRPVPPPTTLPLTATPGAKSLLAQWAPFPGDRLSAWRLRWRRVEKKPGGAQEALKNDAESLSLPATTTSHTITGLPLAALWTNATNMMEVMLNAVYTPAKPLGANGTGEAPSVVNLGGGRWQVTWVEEPGPPCTVFLADGTPVSSPGEAEPGWVVEWRNVPTEAFVNNKSEELPAGTTSYIIEGGPASGLEARVTGTWETLYGQREVYALPEGMPAEVPWRIQPPQNVQPVKPKVGDVMGLTPGVWGGDPITSRAYQWYRQGFSGDEATAAVAIPGATSSTYTVTAEDVGLQVRVEEIPTNAVGTANFIERSPPGFVIKA